MTATLQFNLPEEAEDFRLAQTGGRYRDALAELDEWLRGQIKHANRPDESSLAEVRRHLHEILGAENLNLHCESL